MAKRGGFMSLSDMASKKVKSEETARRDAPAQNPGNDNIYMKKPIVDPPRILCQFILQARTEARKLLHKKGITLPINKPFVEIEARIGTIQSPMGMNDMRILPSGAKTLPIQGKQTVVNAFLINSHFDSQPSLNSRTSFAGGITRSHFTKWTGGGIAEPSPISHAFGMKSSMDEIKQQVKQGNFKEVEKVETVYAYPNSQRLIFPGEHPLSSHALQKLQAQHQAPPRGAMETKDKLGSMDIALPSAPYDLRLTVATETLTDSSVTEPPPDYNMKRLKRRRSYTYKSFAWQLDITEVSNADDSQQTNHDNNSNVEAISYELEMELSAAQTIKLVNAPDGDASQKMAWTLAQQLWYMLKEINSLSDILEVDSYIQPHPNKDAVKFALAQCAALRTFMDTKKWTPAIHDKSNQQPPPKLQTDLKFIGCMPVNFSRHNIEEVQRAEGGYYLSEKTDGVRYLMIFTGSSVVLVDRAMKGNQPISLTGNSDTEPFAQILDLIQPGTVLDGEVVMNRKYRRPIFIVFDVMCCGTNPVLHLNFSQRLKCLTQAEFRTKTANRDMFANVNHLKGKDIPLPLVRKNFQLRMELDGLLTHVVEERGMRSYVNGDFHNHLTDGIIFQPNRPYKIATDVHLLKWKYLDTVTIDVQLSPKLGNGFYDRQNDMPFKMEVGGEDGSMVDMSRFVRLPRSEMLRLEADRHETGAKIAEVGFDPETGEWYYLTMRPDKTGPNHISTVLGTILELAESLGVNELRYRMSVKSGSRDTYRKDVRRMMNQLLDFQRKSNKSGR